MKLLYCTTCAYIFSISLDKRSCICRRSSGFYINDKNAVYRGTAIPLGIANLSFALAYDDRDETGLSSPFNAFVIEKNCPTFSKEDEMVVIEEVEYPSIIAACRAYGISESTYYKRRRRGWSMEKAITTPLSKNQHK